MKTVILAYLIDPETQVALLVSTQPNPKAEGALVGLSGEMHEGESLRAAMARTIQEQAGLSVPASKWTHIGTAHVGAGNPGVGDVIRVEKAYALASLPPTWTPSVSGVVRQSIRRPLAKEISSTAARDLMGILQYLEQLTAPPARASKPRM